MPTALDNEAFRTALVEFDVQAKTNGAELIGTAHALFFQRRAMAASQIESEIESLRDSLRSLNNSFAALERAHAAMAAGETVSRVCAAEAE